ncbi:MAG TPA: DUF559 domain-containing protein [Solirubrobacterales bacterium]|nr:DUF559 domain-containing protein [Solirubrobacterales bacterium]
MAARQWGVVSVGQLTEMGFGRAVVSRWVNDRRLHRVHPGVYAVGHPALGLEGRLAAALFYAGRGAALWGVTAGSWLGILPAEPERVHVCVPGRRVSLPHVRVHGAKDCRRIWHHRLPVTTAAQTLLDIAAQVSFTQLRRALAEAEYLRLVTLDDVEAILGRGRRGSRALRAALYRHRPELARTRRGSEERFLLLCERHCLTRPEVNVSVAGWVVDAVWFEHRLVVELDSRMAHSTSRAIENDHQRDLELRAAGYTVLRYTWQQVTRRPEQVIVDLRRHGIA